MFSVALNSQLNMLTELTCFNETLVTGFLACTGPAEIFTPEWSWSPGFLAILMNLLHAGLHTLPCTFADDIMQQFCVHEGILFLAQYQVHMVSW